MTKIKVITRLGSAKHIVEVETEVHSFSDKLALLQAVIKGSEFTVNEEN